MVDHVPQKNKTGLDYDGSGSVHNQQSLMKYQSHLEPARRTAGIHTTSIALHWMLVYLVYAILWHRVSKPSIKLHHHVLQYHIYKGDMHVTCHYTDYTPLRQIACITVDFCMHLFFQLFMFALIRPLIYWFVFMYACIINFIYSSVQCTYIHTYRGAYI